MIFNEMSKKNFRSWHISITETVIIFYIMCFSAFISLVLNKNCGKKENVLWWPLKYKLNNNKKEYAIQLEQILIFKIVTLQLSAKLFDISLCQFFFFLSLAASHHPETVLIYLPRFSASRVLFECRLLASAVDNERCSRLLSRFLLEERNFQFKKSRRRLIADHCKCSDSGTNTSAFYSKAFETKRAEFQGQAESTSNYVASPIGYATILSIIAQGSVGKTREEILTVLEQTDNLEDGMHDAQHINRKKNIH